MTSGMTCDLRKDLAFTGTAADMKGIRMQRSDLETYIGHFNGKRYAQQIAYYAPDVSYSVGTVTLSSPQAIADFYADFHQYVDEHVELGDCLMGGDLIAATLPSRFQPRIDYAKHGLTFRAGKLYEITTFAWYVLKEDKIWRIKTARHSYKESDV